MAKPVFYIAIVLLAGIAPNSMMCSYVSSARAISQTPGVFPLNSKPYGLTYSDWASKWWQWAISIPSSMNPLTDNTGTHCAERQQGPIWFLPGTSGGKIDRNVLYLQERQYY